LKVVEALESQHDLRASGTTSDGSSRYFPELAGNKIYVSAKCLDNEDGPAGGRKETSTLVLVSRVERTVLLVIGPN
jgi:hypothetical protein